MSYLDRNVCHIAVDIESDFIIICRFQHRQIFLAIVLYIAKQVSPDIPHIFKTDFMIFSFQE